MNNLSPQYLAGLFDGEGCVSVERTPIGKRGPSQHYDYYRLRVSISSTFPKIIHDLREQFSGHFYSWIPKNPKAKRAYQWSLWSAQIKPFLLLIFPHLIIKKEIVGLGLELQNTMKMGGRHIKITQELHQHRLDIYCKMRSITNRK